METRVSRWGNSLALRLPKAIAEEAGFAEGEPVVMTLEAGRLVVAPSRRIRLATLLKSVNAKNLHDAIESGQAVGREAW